MNIELEPRLCVAVVVERDGQVLLLRRGPGRTWPGHWCLPGGHLEDGETLAGCCRRELAEETGLCCEWFELATLTETAHPPFLLLGLVYWARGVEGEPENREPESHDRIGWFGWDELPGLLMPGTAQFVARCRSGGSA